MQLTDLYKPLDQLSDDELRERLQGIRHNRTRERPAAKARAKKEAKKGATKRLNQLEMLLSLMSPEEREAFLTSAAAQNGE